MREVGTERQAAVPVVTTDGLLGEFAGELFGRLPIGPGGVLFFSFYRCLPSATGRRISGIEQSFTSLVKAVYGGHVPLWSDAELDELIEEVIIDAYNDEQLGSFECVIADSDLPVAAEALGMECTLVEVVVDDDERRGLVGVIDLDGRRHRLSLLDVTITDVASEAAQLLAAFRRWWVPPG